MKTEPTAPYEEICHQADNEEWLAARPTLIGASESPILLLGKHYGRTPFTLYAEKLGIAAHDTEQTEGMLMGIRSESWSRECLQDDLGDNYKVIPFGVLLRSNSVAFMGATPDSSVMSASTNRSEQGIAQHKTKGSIKAWSEGVPEAVVIQCQHEMFVTGAPFCYATLLAGDFGGLAFRWAKIERDDKFINDVLLPKCVDFWEAVQSKTPPDPDGSEESYRSALKLLRPEAGKAVALDGEWIDRDARIQELVGLQKGMAYEERELRGKLALAMGDAAEAYLPNGVKWRRSVVQRKGYVVEPSESVQLRRTDA